MKRRDFCIGAALSLGAALGAVRPAIAEKRIRATLFKSPQCDCCDGYAAYLRRNGFEVEVKTTHDLANISRKAGVPEAMQGCHTSFIEGYVVDGHVPISAIRKMLAERPAIAGITLPGMPDGSPGMSGRKKEPFRIYAVHKNGAAPTLYAVE
ncbi:MAG TPA: DUF411 domain-containing protein [Xanthobacteraceae bacterium]|nr:DUF411 domain-containing protein [Xanthobacteraceae bacterium]